MQQCASASPTCTCTFCTVNYHCPDCTRKPHVRTKCRLEAELLAKREAELRAIAKLEKDREERGQADELAGAMNEFFAALYVSDIVAGFDSRVSEPTGHEFPLASPDSITVTTEFGVVEESGTVTVISASGPSPHHQVFDNENDNDTEDESNVEMTEDLHHDMPELQASLSALVQQQNTQELEVGTMQDVSDDEADVDTDGFEADADADAESAFIEEFLDDENENEMSGTGLTPTVSATMA
jgi:hypothetical protein